MFKKYILGMCDIMDSYYQLILQIFLFIVLVSIGYLIVFSPFLTY